LAHSRIASGANTWNVMQVEAGALTIGAEEGLFEPMDRTGIGGRQACTPQVLHESGAGICGPTTASRPTG